MKVVHRIIPTGADGEKLLRSVGWGPDDVVFVVAESHHLWERIRRGVEEKSLRSLMSYKEYTPREIESARWLEMSLWLHGYPQPEDDDAYLVATYDRVCATCGRRGDQRAPFRLRGEPRWGRRGMMSLFWIYDAIFVRPEVHAAVFSTYGLACREVLGTRGQSLKTVVQVEVPRSARLDVAEQRGRLCKTCKHRRYARRPLKELPHLLEAPESDVALTVERFGEGLESSSAVVVSGRFYKALQAAKVKGAEFSVLTVADGGK